MALDHYKGGSNPAPDFLKDEDGYRLGRIRGKWEDALASAVPNHSERNWNHGAQMTEREGLTDGDIDSQREVNAVAKWLKENTPGVEEPIVRSDRAEEAVKRVSRWEDPKHPEYHNFSERIFGPGNEYHPVDFDRSDEYRSRRPGLEYNFTENKFLNDSNQAREELNAEAKANNLLNDYKNNIARTFWN